MSLPPSPPAARVPWAQPFHVMVKPIGSRCNLACSYCFYLEKAGAIYPGGGARRMDDETLECFVRDYLASQPGEEVTFAWQGGEPTLMGLDFFRRAVALQKTYGGGRRVSNALQTNGTLIDDAWADFFAKEGFLIGLSVDGPKALHDPYRVDRGGGPTWDAVMKGLRTLRRHRVAFNTLTVLHRRNVNHAADVYDFLKDEGSRFLQFIPLVERRPGDAEAAAGLDHAAPAWGGKGLVPAARAAEAVAPECAEPERIGRFLTTVFDEWVRRDVGRVFVQLFDVTLGAWMGQRGLLCVFAERCGRALALEHNGDLYACDHYVYPEHRWGNVRERPLAELANGPESRRFGDAKADLPGVCRRCPVRFACNGDCPKHRFVEAAPGEPGLSYLCPAFKRFFQHTGPAMERMAALLADGRPAAEIMRRPVPAGRVT
jgi:uncharacterized protein